jgi:hypothetical protein
MKTAEEKKRRKTPGRRAFSFFASVSLLVLTVRLKYVLKVTQINSI